MCVWVACVSACLRVNFLLLLIQLQVDFAASAVVTLPRCNNEKEATFGRAFHVVNTSPTNVLFSGKNIHMISKAPRTTSKNSKALQTRQTLFIFTTSQLVTNHNLFGGKGGIHLLIYERDKGSTAAEPLHITWCFVFM